MSGSVNNNVEMEALVKAGALKYMEGLCGYAVQKKKENHRVLCNGGAVSGSLLREQ